MARKFEEEKVLAIAKIVHQALRAAENSQAIGVGHSDTEIPSRL